MRLVLVRTRCSQLGDRPRLRDGHWVERGSRRCLSLCVVRRTRTREGHGGGAMRRLCVPRSLDRRRSGRGRIHCCGTPGCQKEALAGQRNLSGYERRAGVLRCEQIEKDTARRGRTRDLHLDHLSGRDREGGRATSGGRAPTRHASSTLPRRRPPLGARTTENVKSPSEKRSSLVVVLSERMDINPDDAPPCGRERATTTRLPAGSVAASLEYPAFCGSRLEHCV